MENLLPLKERVQIIKDQVDYSVERPAYKTGGQNCGIMSGAIIAKHEDLGIEIKIKTFRSMQKNKELSKTVIELIIDELIN